MRRTCIRTTSSVGRSRRSTASCSPARRRATRAPTRRSKDRRPMPGSTPTMCSPRSGSTRPRSPSCARPGRSSSAVATLVCFHAHPDDESIATGGGMRRAADEGHDVVLVVATGGEEGEVAEGFLADGELLGDRRLQETIASAEVLGVKSVEWLGYRDSGMVDTPTTKNPECFWQADVE